jgi:sugar phosphate isomerase/epimerase
VSIGSWAFAFGPYAANPWSFAHVCEYAASVGFDGVEINGFWPHPRPEDLVDVKHREVLRSIITGVGLGVSGYAPDFHAVPPALVPLTDYLAAIDGARAVCEALEIPVLRVDTVMAPEEMSAERYRNCCDSLIRAWSAAAELCSRSDVTLVWEFEPGFWLNRPSEVEHTLSAVGHPSFGVLFDSSHAFTGGLKGARQGRDPELVKSVAAYANRLLPYIRHLHLADSNGTLHGEDTSVHTALGEGEVDFAALILALEPIADRLPWWCVDLCYCEDADRLATASLRYVRRLLGQVGPSEIGLS